MEPNWPSSWTRAALELSVLAAVEDLGTTHGYQVARHLADAGLGGIKGGTLYPVLSRLEEQGLTSTRWVEGLGGPGRKLVEITPAGRTERRVRQAEWLRWTATVHALLTAGPDRQVPTTPSPGRRGDRSPHELQEHR